MGTRYQWIDNCPNCGEHSLDCYDAPTCVLWARTCDRCGYIDRRDYYEDGKDGVYLCTEDEAKKKGLLTECPLCGQYCNCWQIEQFKVCFECEVHTERR